MSITDRSQAIEECSKNGDALMNCSSNLKDDKDLVMLAVQTAVDALLWASPRLKEDKEVLLKACSCYGRAIRYTQQLRSDRDVVMTAVNQNGNALQHVPTATGLKNDIDIVKCAVRSQPLSLQYASEECRRNVDLLVIAGKLNPKVLTAASTKEARKEAEKRLQNLDERWSTSNSTYGEQ